MHFIVVLRRNPLSQTCLICPVPAVRMWLVHLHQFHWMMMKNNAIVVECSMKMNFHQVLTQMMVNLTPKLVVCMHFVEMMQTCWAIHCMVIICLPSSVGVDLLEGHHVGIADLILIELGTTAISKSCSDLARHMHPFFLQMPLRHIEVLVERVQQNQQVRVRVADLVTLEVRMASSCSAIVVGPPNT